LTSTRAAPTLRRPMTPATRTWWSWRCERGGSLRRDWLWRTARSARP